MKPLRVLLLCDRLDIAGGVERFVCQLANHLAGQGMDVAVGSVATPRVQMRYVVDPAVRVLAGSVATRASGGGAWTLLRAQWRIGRTLAGLIRDDRPDVVVLNGLTTACSVLVMDRRIAPRAICCDHNHFDARSRLWRRLRAWLYPRVGAVVSLTEADAARFRALNPRTQVIYNASSLSAGQVVPPADPLVLAVGRHVAQKGFDLLLNAWATVAEAVPQARLRVIGEGPLRDEAMALADRLGIAGRIEWLAVTERIEAHYAQAAVFVLPSRYEGMPLALLEAQAMGVPAVAFDCPTGPREIVTAETGIVVPALDVPSLAQALVTLLTHPALRERMARAALRRSREVFGLQTHLGRWTALVDEVGSLAS